MVGWSVSYSIGVSVPKAARSTALPRTTITRRATTPQPAIAAAKLIRAELGRVRVVAARPNVPGYKRNQFGRSWTDDHADAFRRPSAFISMLKVTERESLQTSI